MQELIDFLVEHVDCNIIFEAICNGRSGISLHTELESFNLSSGNNLEIVMSDGEVNINLNEYNVEYDECEDSYCIYNDNEEYMIGE